MTKNICLSAIFAFILTSCGNNHTSDKPQQEAPKALEDKNSFEVASKLRYSEDLMEDLYNELASKDVELKRLEEQINDLNSSKHDSLKLFERFDQKIQSYFRSADNQALKIKDSLLREKMKILIAGTLAKYDLGSAKHHDLLKTIPINDAKISDLHTVLRIVRTLPVVEKHQQDNLPTTRQLEGFIRQQQQTINLIDTLIKK
ncbi:hypothetical protein [Chitinophaga varians]|uniref:hypothetical protein n=1 Tax=Chitinophaga varians TaxID=2202339 RepID=UPI00165EC77E|nr:hypothetical protein [Chitinophaga varians]MBC9913056.1 hypothetical protein [Chitinophaga varians]